MRVRTGTLSSLLLHHLDLRLVCLLSTILNILISFEGTLATLATSKELLDVELASLIALILRDLLTVKLGQLR